MGGVDEAMESTLLPTLTVEGFKGCIDHLHVLGRPVDFSGSMEAEQVNFNSPDNESRILDTYLFDGESFARYGS